MHGLFLQTHLRGVINMSCLVLSQYWISDFNTSIFFQNIDFEYDFADGGGGRLGESRCLAKVLSQRHLLLYILILWKSHIEPFLIFNIES